MSPRIFGALALLAAISAAATEAPAQESNLSDRLVTTREVAAVRGSGEGAETVYGERRFPVVTREVIGLRGSGDGAEIVYGETVYPVLTLPIAAITGSGTTLKVVYAPVDPAAYQALVARLNGDRNGPVAELSAGAPQFSSR